MTREERLKLLKQIEKDIYVCSIESTFLDDAKSCAIHSIIEELEQEPCEDAVSRNAITKTLNEMDRYIADELTLCGSDNKFPKNEVFIVDDVYEQIVEQLSSVTDKMCFTKDIQLKPLPKERREWIPVSERLPETDEDVLITDGVTVYIGWMIDAADRRWRADSGDNYFINDVIAWMPLPPSYQGEENG